MRKWFLVLIAAVLALPFFGTSVFAEEEVVYEDGSYEVPMVVKFGETVFEHFSETATIKIENDKQYIQFGYIQTDVILDVTIPNGEVEIIGEDEEALTREIEFEYAGDLNEPVPFSVHMFYGQTHDMLAYLDMSEVPVVEDQDEPEEEQEDDTKEDEGTKDEETSNEDEDQSGNEEGTNEKDNESNDEKDSNSNGSDEGTEQPEEEVESVLDITNLDNGFYTINADYLYIDKDDPSAIAGYLDDSIFLEVKNGKVKVTVTINENETVTLLKVAGKNSIESKVNGEKRYETFSLNELEQILTAYVEYQAPFGDTIFEGKADFRIVLDEATIKEAKESDKPGFEVKQEVPKKNSNHKKDPKPTPKPKPKEKVNPLAADRAYEINYTILDENGNKVSAADQFFEKPAILFEKDGVYYVQITTNANQFIDSLSNQYGEFVYAGIDENGNHVYQFRIVGDLTDQQIIDMVITVPGVYNQQKHTTRLVLDLDSMKEVNAADYQLVSSEDSSNGPNPDGTQPKEEQHGGNGKLDPKTPSKPELGDPEGNNNDATPGDGSGLNPKTGEETNIMLYMLLLIASAIPLAVQLKKRFAVK